MKLLLYPLCLALILPLRAEDSKTPPAKPESGRLAKQKILEEERAKNKEAAGEATRIDPVLANFLNKFDHNKDGVLSDEEATAFAEQIAKNYERTSNGIGKEMDANQDGKLSGEELIAVKTKLKYLFDAIAKQMDVTAVLNAAIKNGELSLQISNDNMGCDPSPGGKELRVKYQVKGVIETITVKEYSRLSLKGAGLYIIQAYYGAPKE